MVSSCKIFVSIFLVLFGIGGSEGTAGGLRRSLVDCSLVLCAAVACQAGEEPFVPPGQCCPRCRPNPKDCSNVLCFALPLCEPDEFILTTPSDCCGKCVGGGGNPKVDCSLVKCAAPEGCTQDEWVYLPNQCCPTCPP